MRADQVSPQGNWVFLRLDARREQVGLIHLPGETTGVEKVGHNTAHVVAVGPGRDEERGDKGKVYCFRPRQHLSPGDRILFRDFHREFHPINVEDEGTYFLLHFNDIEAAVEEGVLIGAWSGIQDAEAG